MKTGDGEGQGVAKTAVALSLWGPCSKAGNKEAFMAMSPCLGAKSFPELHSGGGCADPELQPPT